MCVVLWAVLCYEQCFFQCVWCVLSAVQCKLYNARCAMQGVQCKVCCSRDNRFALADAIVGVKIAVQHALRIIQWTPTALSHCWDSITRVELDPSLLLLAHCSSAFIHPSHFWQQSLSKCNNCNLLLSNLTCLWCKFVHTCIAWTFPCWCSVY